MESQKTNRGVIAAVIIALVAVAAYGYFKYVKKDSVQTETPIVNEPETTTGQLTGEVVSPPVTKPAVVTPTNVTSTNSYKNGTYSATGNYISPGGQEQVKVTVTLKDDVIVSSNVESLATRPNSVKFQGMFISGYTTFVVGKDIDSVVLDKVSGSSLTPKGFNDALSQIKVQAKA